MSIDLVDENLVRAEQALVEVRDAIEASNAAIGDAALRKTLVLIYPGVLKAYYGVDHARALLAVRDR